MHLYFIFFKCVFEILQNNAIRPMWQVANGLNNAALNYTGVLTVILQR
jgi:hypothetical protein